MVCCPHCHRTSFTWRDKWRAAGRQRLLCPACQGACSVRAGSADAGLLWTVFVALMSGFAALHYQSSLPWGVGLLIWGLVLAWRVHRREVHPVSDQPGAARNPERAPALEAANATGLFAQITGWF
ncbi:hypothetical protein QRD43_02530 [Pelomonas sp. APW6]|uniref:CXXC-20-CXXC protein n=1 Tax=Roseateles subflavus TaxID=3053353 RepID=A0ABT7LD26_9BURK|nr:hypothetical protein [Pelomonas sp. APW6]MDL5030769.1 hypothetical protein [Pelomonas sp. APW6]